MSSIHLELCPCSNFLPAARFSVPSCGFGLTIEADAEELPAAIVPLHLASVIAAFLCASFKKFPVQDSRVCISLKRFEF